MAHFSDPPSSQRTLTINISDKRVTRSRNTTTHPGLVDNPRRRRSPQEVAADKEKATQKLEKAEKAKAKKQGDVALMMAKLKKEQAEDEKQSRTPLPQHKVKNTIRQQGAMLNVLEKDSHDSVGIAVGEKVCVNCPL